MNDLLDLINKRLVEKAKEINERIANSRTKYSEELGMPKNVLSDITAFYVSGKCSLEDNFDNFMAIANNNTLAGIFLLYQCMFLEKAFRKKEAEKKKEERLKLMAFLFIIRNGLEDAFCAFNANYHGNVEEDIQREFERIYGKGYRYRFN